MFPVTVKLGSTDHDDVEYAQVIRARSPLVRPELTELFLSTAGSGYNHTRTVRVPLAKVFDLMTEAKKDEANHFICDLTVETLRKKELLPPAPPPRAPDTPKPGLFRRIFGPA